MPIRWVINPVIRTIETPRDPDTGEASGPSFVLRQPKVHTIIDPSRTGGKPYQHSTVINDDTGTFCLSFVRSQDFGPLTADPQCIVLFEDEYEDIDGFLAKTPRDLGWNKQKVDRVLDRITAFGGDVTELHADAPLHLFVKEVGRLFRPDFPGPFGTYVK
jgi:hypothetical protein